MTKTIVIDSGPLIALSLIDVLPLMPRLFSEIIVPKAVVEETTTDQAKPGATAISNAMEAELFKVRNIGLFGDFSVLAELLDPGEAETLALAEQLKAIALIDERKGRKVGKKRGIKITGTAAILTKAKRENLIQSVRPLLEQLTASGYRLSPALLVETLRVNGE